MLMPRALSASPPKVILLACACLLAAQARALPQGSKQPAGVAAASGIELYRRGYNEAALKSLRDATKHDKSNPEAWHYLGLALVKKETPKDARKAFERAVALRPDYPDALTALAYLLLRQGDTYDAARAAERAVALRPDLQEARYILGVAHLRNQSNSNALEQAEAALKTDPSFSPALYLKVVALAGMSANAFSAATDETQDVRKVLLDKVGARVDEAEAALRRFAELEPTHAEIPQLREQLETLRVYGRALERAAPPGAAGGILPSKDVTTKARMLSRPEPLYTERARKNGTRGTVTLRLVLGADGVVRHILVVRALPDGLTENAIAAARRIKFIPATKDGLPVSVYATIQYNFNIY